jgi:AraC-like DNA-binding protein
MTASDDWRRALFADLLGSIRLQSSIYFWPEFGAPWGFRLADHGTAFHIVTRGHCWLEVRGLGAPVRLSPGDFVLLPRGDSHIMRDAPGSHAVDLFKLVKEHAPDQRGAFCAGGRGPVTKMVCGGMQFENGPVEPLLAVLPPLIHVKASDQRGAAWLRLTVKNVVEELESERAGSEAVATRLGDFLFMQAVRAYLYDNMDSAESGWLAALRDRQIGQALAILHARLGDPWTVSSLARRVALSRSAFAARFTELVGEPPLRYLTRLRLHAGSVRLRTGDAKMSVVAAAAGYKSVAAFTKAFKRELGVTPGEWRRGRPDPTC